MISGVFLLNIAISFAGLLICGAGVLQVLIGAGLDKRVARFFLLFFSFLALCALSNLVGYLLRGVPGVLVRRILFLSNFGEFLFPCIIVYVISLYLMSIVDPDFEQKGERRLMMLLVVIHVILLFISQFNGMYYTIDADNYYHRSTLYPVSYLMTMSLMLIDAYILVTERSKLTEKEEMAFWVCMLVPSLAACAQIFVYGIYFVIFATIISAFFMYVYMLEGVRERQLKQMEEISQLKTDILISQVQPHFIFNSLTAIRSLCDMDSEAYEAIGHFAGYLRGSVDMLNEKSCIPMSREIETVDNYLYMEKLRFEDKLEIICDYKDKSFLIPSCSLQIIAENAVKHGIRHNPEGKGTLILRSYETENSHIVEAEDNGIGFDPDEVSSGTGINNLRRRLEIMCGGDLVIQSEKGKGTLARIIVPKANK